MFTFILVVHAIIAAILVTVILMQRSEGGGLTSGGSPSGLMSARGAADFLTRATSVLATLFVGISILLAVLASTRQTTTIDPTLARRGAPASTTIDTAPTTPDSQSAAAVAANLTAPASNNAVPLAQ